MIAAILEAVKFALNPIPNIEGITLLVIVFTKYFGYAITLPSVLIFAFLECVWWGFGTWSLVYFYMWPLLVLLTTFFVKDNDILVPVILCTAFGFSFGALCSLSTLAIAGPHAAIAWWITGIPYDIIHGCGNLFMSLFLYRPALTALDKIV